ncbi:12688_t:CDS:2, partial [Gigaspora margarita]
MHQVTTNTDHWDMWHWKTEKLKQELEIHNISFGVNATRSELITLLNDHLCLGMINSDKIQDKENENINFVGSLAMNTDSDPIYFPLNLGWALKHNQQLGKRGGRHISPNIVSAIKTFFMAGQLDKSNRFTAKEMVNKLQEIAKSGEISDDDKIPTEQAIKSWISRFSKSSKELSAAESLA